MNLKQIEVFVKVADTKKFSEAAKQLFLSQPTVSVHISSLEKEFGGVLFNRTTKEVELSTLGREAYPYAKKMVELSEVMYDKFCVKKEKEERPLAIAASTIPSGYLLPKAIMEFIKKYPDEKFSITEGDSISVISGVLDGTVDVAMVGTAEEKKYCTYIPFYDDELVIVTPNTSPYKELHEKFANEEGAKIKSALVDELRKSSFVLREEGSGTRKEAIKLLGKVGISHEDINVKAEMTNQEMIKKAIKQGMGVSVMSKLSVEEEVKAGEILSFAMPGTKKGRHIYIVYNKERVLMRSAKRFINVVEKMYGNSLG